MTKTEAYDKKIRESAIFISLNFIPLYGVSIYFDSIASKKEVGAKFWNKKRRKSNTIFFLIWELTNGIVLTANACSLGLEKSGMAIDWDYYINATKSKEVRGRATKSEKVKGGVESSEEKLPESRTASYFLSLDFAKDSWKAAMSGWDKKEE